uniref:Transmembrane protein n=1 Tax=Ananas comosus var. bracteatus TaxID=296719 RepID=A0A6V7QC04_ANACO|nr:unnamed protein product [Ananas comosus var. bracteatus]
MEEEEMVQPSFPLLRPRRRSLRRERWVFDQKKKVGAFCGLGGVGVEGMEGGISFWQALSLSAIVGWVGASASFDLTRRFRALTQPWVTRRVVVADTPSILRLQRWHHRYLDNMFSVLSCVVSVPFYTGFLPLLFWSGHSKLARQMTLLMAFCDYTGTPSRMSYRRPGRVVLR